MPFLDSTRRRTEDLVLPDVLHTDVNRAASFAVGLDRDHGADNLSSYVFMKVLESSAHRYDRGMRLLSRGRIGSVYDRVAELAAIPGNRILDIGCGTGGVALACAGRGAHVVGIDLDAEMLGVARAKSTPFGLRGSVEWNQLGVAEIEDRFDPDSFDAVTACLVMSELSPDEQKYAIAVALSRLAPGGEIVIADEVSPNSPVQRLLYRLGRFPLVMATYALAQITTRPADDLAVKLRDTGFVDVLEERPWPAFAIVRGCRPLEAA